VPALSMLSPEVLEDLEDAEDEEPDDGEPEEKELDDEAKLTFLQVPDWHRVPNPGS